MTQYVTTADALFFHKQLITTYGGMDGVRGLGVLGAALYRPQTAYCDSVVHEAAALFESLMQTIHSWTETSESRSQSSMSFCESTDM